jgi:hypothetical protein
VVNKSFSLALNSQLDRNLSSKAYYNWYKRDNESEHVVFTPSGPGSGGNCDLGPTGASLPTCTTEFLHFEKKNFGLEVYWRFARSNKLTAGIDYLETERERIDFDRSKETKGTLEWKSGAFEVADVRVKYTHLRRKSDFLLGASSNIFDRYLYRFDAAPLDRDQLKVVFDASPAPLLDLGAEFIYKKNKSKDTVLGRTKDERNEVALSVSYGNPNALRITAFADYEHTKYESTHWVGATTTFPNPNTAGTTFLWESDVKDKNYLVGVGAEWKAMPRLRVVGSAIWQKADGAVDFVTQNNLANPMNIDRYDNFNKKTLNLRAIYAATPRLDVSIGAAYEKYDYSDIQMDDYLYVVRTGAAQTLAGFLTGAFAFPNYKASIVYATLSYRF